MIGTGTTLVPYNYYAHPGLARNDQKIKKDDPSGYYSLQVTVLLALPGSLTG